MRAWIRALGFGPSLLVASTSSVLIGLGAPPGGWIFCEWLGFVPLILMVRRPSVTPRQALWLGWVGGLGIGLVGFPWIAEMLVRFAGLPWWLAVPGLFLFSSWMAIPWALFGLGLRLGPQQGPLSYLWSAALFVSLMFLWPNLFPYTPLLGFAERPALMQAAEAVGVHGLEAIVVVWALCAARVIAGPGRVLRQAAVVILLPPLLLALGHLRMQAIDRELAQAPSLVVGIVQPNVPPGGATSAEHLKRLWSASAELERQGAQILVWPEAGAYPHSIARPHTHDRELGPRGVLRDHRLATLFGASSREPGARFGFNSMYFIDAEGVVRGRYDKVNRVPVGEVIPLVDPSWVSERIPYIGQIHAGRGPERFVFETEDGQGTVSLGPLICYEDILPGFVLELSALPGGIDLFVNATIDAWYGYGSEPWEHLALAQFRSVEHRIPLIRSTTTGVSAVVDATGRVVAHLPVRPVERETLRDYPPDTLLARVRLARNTAVRPTLYARVGWLFPYLCLITTGAFGLIWLRQRLAAPAIEPPSGPSTA